jgi:hypothetical protein
MKALKISEDKREELTANNIVICTYILEDESEADCIDISLKSKYPNFIEVTVKDNELLY